MTKNLIASKQDAWLICNVPRDRPRCRLFCFHYAGGGASIFRDWSDRLPSDLEVYAVQLPGRENRFKEKLHTNMPQLIGELCEVIDRYTDTPFSFFGHSMGALVAFELARSLRQQYAKNPEHLFVSARQAPHIQSLESPLHQLPPMEFLARIRLLNGTPDSILNNRELMDLMMPILRADFTVCETYQYQALAPLNCPITVIGGKLDKLVGVRELRSWQEHTTNICSLHLLNGDHFFINSCQSDLAKIITNNIGW